MTTSPSTLTRPRGDHRLGSAARGDAGVGEVLGEAHQRGSGSGLICCNHYGRWTCSSCEQTLAEREQPRFRARQVWAWTARGARGYEEMTDLPAELRETLARELPFSTLTLAPRGARERRDGQGAASQRATAARSRPC